MGHPQPPRGSTLLLLVFGACIATAASQPGPSPGSHEEIDPIGPAEQERFENLVTFCMTAEGDLLACDAGAKAVRKLNAQGKKVAEWTFDFAPHAVHACPDGTVYIAGQGTIARLDHAGRVQRTATASELGFPDGKPSGITATDRDVFLCVGFGWSLRSKSSVVRFDRDLESATTILEDLRGCCQRLDIVARDGDLYIAENSRYRVLKCDREGNILSKWGQKDRVNVEGFGSCCNPMNLCFGPGGHLYTAESGLGRIKRYTPDGEFVGLVGHVGVDRFNRAGRLAASCSNISLAVDADGARVYVLDFKNNIVRVLARKGNGSDDPTP
jgi:sugar lactone lactonase YvrE